MLPALIERLEKAEEGSRELSNDIAEAAGWERNDARSFVWKSPEGFAHHTAPDFSRSLDAARTLVPEGYDWSLSGSGTACMCSCWADDYAPVFRSTDRKQPLHTRFEKWQPKAATAAVALGIASLKARAAATVAP